VFIAVM